MKKSWTIDELNDMYTQGESVDQEDFAEKRSNLLLVAGDHYNKKGSNFYNRIRSAKDLSNEQKIRLTKNHIQYICDSFVNNIVAPNPGVGFVPKNEKEMHDQKVAQMHHDVWRDAHDKYEVDSLVDDWAEAFVQLGEVHCDIYFDPMKGPIKAYPQKSNEEGQPLFVDPLGQETVDDGTMMGMPNQAVPDLDNPIHWGEFCLDEVLGFNLIRPVDCKDLRKAPWLAIRYMVAKKDLVAKFPDINEKIINGMDETYQVFNHTAGNYSTSDKEVMVIKYYVRPCVDYPNGHFFLTTKLGVLAEGDLPGGVFPLATGLFRKFKTAPRGKSPIKTMRPYQVEINRAASKMAEHQVTLGDDKILIQDGSKLTNGAVLPGIRGIFYSGIDPKILAGRDGSQYLNYSNSNIAELYQVMGVKEDMEELPAQLDPYVMLFRSARQKKKFQRNIKRFENFYTDVVKIYLKLAKIHLTDDYLVYALGSAERVNIPEFRSAQDLCYEIKVEAQADDIETKIGKQIVINHALQYVGNQLDKDTLGKLFRTMPYVNEDQSFDDMTLDFDLSVNDILALDRGESPPIGQYDNHDYLLKKLTFRVRQPDFRYLPPQVQQNYAAKIKVHQDFKAQQAMAIQRAQQGLIPTGGYLAKVDLYVSDPNDPNKSQRVTLPSEAIQWLIKQMEAQNAGLAPLADMNLGVMEQISNLITAPEAGSIPAAPQAPMNAGGLPPL